MKILIWGTGEIAKQILSKATYDVLHVAIEAFVDNDIRKVGGQFMNKKIISPMEIKDYTFDKIYILNSYEEEIKRQAVNELQLELGVLEGVEGFSDIMARVLIENYSIQNKKTLIIGDGKIYSQRKNIYIDLFDIVGFVEVQHLERVNEYQYDYIMLMNLMDIPYMDRRGGREVLENNVKQELRNVYNVAVPIFTEWMYQCILNSDRLISLGDENADKTFMVIGNASGAGLGYRVLVVENGVHYALKKGYIPVVDMMTYPSQYLKAEEVGKVNAWEKFFEQPCGYSLNDIKKSKNVIVTACKPYCERKQKDLFFLKEKPYLQKKANEFLRMNSWETKNILGVLVRGTDYINRHPYGHPIQPRIELVFEKVREAMKYWNAYDYIYLCTEVQEYVELFQKEFGNMVIYYPQRRICADYSEYLCEHKFDRENDEYYRGVDYWVALKVLSRCNALIAGDCGGSQVARKLNDNKYEHTYIFDLGRYGIDDIG